MGKREDEERATNATNKTNNEKKGQSILFGACAKERARVKADRVALQPPVQ